MWKIENGTVKCPKCSKVVVITTAFRCVNAYCDHCGWHSSNITDAQMRELQDMLQNKQESEEEHR